MGGLEEQMEMYSLEAENMKSRCGQSHAPSEGFLACLFWLLGVSSDRPLPFVNFSASSSLKITLATFDLKLFLIQYDLIVM